MAVEITYFVHGTTLDNLEGKATGWLMGELSTKGINQSIELREQVDIQQFAVVYCSDLQRAIDSAKITFEDRVPIIQDSRIRECNYGNLNGTDSKQVIYEDHILVPFPGGESMQDVENRMRAFCIELQEKQDGKKVAIVAHKAPQLALEVICHHKTWEEAITQDWRKKKAWQPGWEYRI